MAYKIKDLQITRYYGDGMIFDSREEAIATLMDFHVNDIPDIVDWEEEEILATCGWELEEVKNPHEEE